ncbi:hypothetical protein L7F22_013090 [Adiantum nelumboides]|nr:hypothetical protein [Adiantum nelumboides]
MEFFAKFLLLLLFLSASHPFFEDRTTGFAQRDRSLADNTCGPVNCVNGVCSVSVEFPFYKCTCNKGWKSPLNASWIPCVLPNCSLDLSCGNNTSLSAPPPAFSPTLDSFSLCLLPICGNGDCVASSNSSLSYECKCNAGSTNIFNSSNGYCIQQCAIGAGCSGLNGTLGSSPPPPSSSAGQNSSQGTRQRYAVTLIIGGFLLLQMLLQMGWSF